MKTLVIGGGMSGLTYGIVAVKNGNDVTIAERNSRLGKKISMTGNGKCNIGNVNTDVGYYNGGVVVDNVLAKISVKEYRQFLYSCGIITYCDDEGRLYPVCNNAPNVVDCLRYQFSKFGGKIFCDTQVNKIVKKDGYFDVTFGNGTTQNYDKVIVCCGSGAQADKPCLEGIDSKYFTPLYPSLTPIKVAEKPTAISGQRAKANVTLLQDGKVVAIQSGEVLFREYGLSGICIFNLSAIIARNYVKGINAKYNLVVDILPDIDENSLQKLIDSRLGNYDNDKLLYGLLPNVTANYLIKRHGDTLTLAHFIKNLTFTFDGLCNYQMCQVTAGGVRQNAVDDKLTLPNGITVLGEALDVDGLCGGYNLYFASASALYLFDETSRNNAYNKQ